MKQIVPLIGVVLMASLFCGSADAQVVRYRFTKSVDRSTGAEYSGDNDVQCIKFSYDKSSFQFTDGSGKPLPGGQWQPSESYCNREYSTVSYGYGSSISQPTGKWCNERIFRYQRTENGVRKYLCRRPVVSIQNGSIVGYINDWIYFAEDYSRFNIYSGGSATDNGYNGDSWELPWGSLSGNIPVFERIDNTPSGTLY